MAPCTEEETEAQRGKEVAHVGCQGQNRKQPESQFWAALCSDNTHKLMKM